MATQETDILSLFFCRRRCKIAETLVEKNFELAFQVIYEFNLPGSQTYDFMCCTCRFRAENNLLLLINYYTRSYNIYRRTPYRNPEITSHGKRDLDKILISRDLL